MKKFTLLVLSACFILINIYSQSTLELIFTAKNTGQYVPLDSIFVKNLTQGGDTTLYAPDTVLILDYATSIGDHEAISKNSLTVSQNYPNPFSNQTAINIYLPQKENIEIIVRDISGRELGYYERTLNAGKHTYTLYPGNEKFYLCTVSGEYASETIKMVNANSNPSIGSQCKIVYTGYDKTAVNIKSQKSINSFVFDPGDQLRYIGFAKTVNEFSGSDVIEDAPVTNELYVFEITEGIPCPGIPTITYQSREYNTVFIGSQCWLKENLNIGTMIPGSNDMTDNGILEKYCYDDDTNSCDFYGALYQWDEIMKYTLINGTQGICPIGWHIPTDEELKILEGTVDSFFPVGDPEWDGTGYRGSDVGLNLKSTIGWVFNGNGVDKFGFSDVPCGYRTYSGNFNDWGYSGGLWSSTGDTGGAMARVTLSESNQQKRNGYDKHLGFPVRCLRD